MVSLLIISHQYVGKALVKTTQSIFGKLPLPTAVVEVPHDANIETTLLKIKALIKKIDHGQGILVLTDMFGSTPSNIAQNLTINHHLHIISGVNLPMLTRIMNYPHLPLSKLTQKAISGGKAGVLNCKQRLNS